MGSALGAGGGISIRGRGWDQHWGQGVGSALGAGGEISIRSRGWDQH